MVVRIERDDALIDVDCPSGREDWLVINNEGLLYPLPMEWRTYNMEDWG